MNTKKVIEINSVFIDNNLNKNSLNLFLFFADHEEGTLSQMLADVGHSEPANHKSTQNYRIRLGYLRDGVKDKSPLIKIKKMTIKNDYSIRGKMYVLTPKGKSLMKKLEKLMGE